MAETVTLIAPTGDKVTVSDAVSVNALVYGSGYKVDGGKTPEQAIEELAKSAQRQRDFEASEAVKTTAAKQRG